MEAITRNFTDNSWVFILLLSMIVILGISRILFQRNYASKRTLTVFQENQENFFLFAMMTHLLLIGLIGLLLFPFINISSEVSTAHPIVSLLVIIFLWFIFRFLVNTLLMYLVGIGDYFREFINTQVYFRFFAVFVLILAVLFMYYSSIQPTLILYISLIFLGFMLILEYIFQIRKIGSQWMYSSYYFILYLCMLEILPILYVVKHWNELN